MMNEWTDVTQQVAVTHTEMVASHHRVIASACDSRAAVDKFGPL